MPLKNGSYTYGPWLDPPLPIYFKMYMFDLTNPLEVVNEGAKPFFREKGPYTYRLWPKKINITFNNNNTVTYRETHTYVFQRNMSVGPSTDRFLTLNLPLLTVTTLIRKEYPFIKDMVKLMLSIEKSYSLFVNVSVDEFVWGYQDPVLKQVKALLSYFDIPFDDHFGFFYKVRK
ncbi:hypothetical protein FSP39_007666 [Pinctada imbricata]|uniref:Uncharacterized protein n=1 Tax=Pinctada imbricata TaxID=66713 RepID=A0AA88XLI7_PINIB|nr:hypothetical protein FSP39_007666 [Pinctada imbricata]